MEKDKQPKVKKQTRKPAKAQPKADMQPKTNVAQVLMGAYRPLPNFKGCRNC